MKKWLIGIGIVLLLAIGGLVGYAYTLPDKVHVEREIEINAPPEVIFAEINDLHRWPNWEPWGKEFDPTVEHEYSGPDSGEDAERSWQGEKAGVGRQKI